MALKVIDRAMQVHGAEGISQDQPLAYMYANLRTLRYADVSGVAIRGARPLRRKQQCETTLTHRARTRCTSSRSARPS